MAVIFFTAFEKAFESTVFCLHLIAVKENEQGKNYYQFPAC